MQLILLVFTKGKVVFYGNIRIYLEEFKKLLEFFSFFSKNEKLNSMNENNWEDTNKILEEVSVINKYLKQFKEDFEELDETVNEEAKKPIILTSLNPRAVNKDQNKIESEFQKVLSAG